MAQADLQVTQSASTTQPAFGAPLTHAVLVKNSGPDTAASVMLTDSLGADGVAQSASASNGGPCLVAGQTISCALGDIPSSGQVSVSIAALAPAFIQGSSMTTASVSSATFDPSTANNSASTAITPR